MHYPGESGDIAVGGVDFGEYLCQLRDQEVMLIVAPLGPVEEPPIICGLCGTPRTDDECPTCRTEWEDAKRVIDERFRRDSAYTLAHRQEVQDRGERPLFCDGVSNSNEPRTPPGSEVTLAPNVSQTRRWSFVALPLAEPPAPNREPAAPW